MYKRRFNTWGIGKNVKRKNISQLQPQQELTTDGSPNTDVGWPEMKHMKNQKQTLPYANRSQDAEFSSTNHVTLLDARVRSKTATPAMLSISCRKPSPGPSLSTLFSIESPDDLRPLERWMALVGNYVPAAFEMGLWKPLPGGTLFMNKQLIAWYNRTRTCSMALKIGDSRQAFRALGTCLDEYQEMMASQDPLLILFTLHSLLPIVNQNADIASSLFRYVRDIARIVHPKTHPMRLMMEHLFQLGLAKVAENAGSLLRPYFILICRTLGPHIVPLAEAFAVITRANGTHDPSELAVAGMYHQEAINRLEIFSRTFAFEILGLRLARAWNLLRRDLLANAKEIALAVKESEEASRHPNIMTSCHQLLFHIYSLGGEYKEALELAHTRVEYSIEHFGLGSYITIDALGSMESYLRNIGDKRGADQAFKGLVAATDELNQKRNKARKAA